jgi:leader peptidase (prepilin peptidase)/N-methyltransferase
MDDLLMKAPLLYQLCCAFVLGAVVGSLLNVCIIRLPQEKSILWPSSRCGRCLQPIRMRDNIPLVSYWLLRGRCRVCGQPFSIRYFLVELLTALAFLGLYYAEVVKNVQGVPFLNAHQIAIQQSVPPLPALAMFLAHAVLLSLLIAAAVCDLDSRQIPPSVTLPGALLGLVCATLMPWPWPNTPAEALPRIFPLQPPDLAWWVMVPPQGPQPGFQPWPVWGPLPAWLPPGSWQLGLVTGLAGALAGTGMLRAVKFLFERGLGKEALGLGDADLMMMAGAFLGWQIVVASFFVGALVALAFALVPMFARFVWRSLRARRLALGRTDDTSLPFGPGLAVGTALTWLAWGRIGPAFQVVFFNGYLVAGLAVVGGVLIFLISAALGRAQGRPAARE